MPTGPLWRYASGETSEKTIREAERVLGVRFPNDYRACVRENPGAAPQPSGFSLEFAPGRSLNARVGVLLTLDPGDGEDVLGTRYQLAMDGRIPEGVVPIVTDEDGNCVCLDYRADPSREAPTIAYASADPSIGIVPLAGTFAEFLAKLS